MSKTLKQSIATDLVLNALNTNEFAESVTFDPGDGSPSRSIDVMIDDSEQTYRIGDMVSENERRITVLAAKDVDATSGGIATLNESDQITRSDGRVYGWTGTVVQEDAASWQLEYRYYELRGAGSQTRRS